MHEGRPGEGPAVVPRLYRWTVGRWTVGRSAFRFRLLVGLRARDFPVREQLPKPPFFYSHLGSSLHEKMGTGPFS